MDGLACDDALNALIVQANELQRKRRERENEEGRVQKELERLKESVSTVAIEKVHLSEDVAVCKKSIESLKSEVYAAEESAAALSSDKNNLLMTFTSVSQALDRLDSENEEVLRCGEEALTFQSTHNQFAARTTKHIGDHPAFGTLCALLAPAAASAQSVEVGPGAQDGSA